MNKKAPKISFIISARNDDYGGNFLFRLNSFIRNLAYLAGKHRLDAELIVVEYNPFAEEKTLSEILIIHQNPSLPIRVITVPPEFHEKIKQDSKTPFLEYVAKNVGIRRAQGRFIATTNPDIIFSNSCIAFLAKSNLEFNKFYRLNRHDLPGYGLPKTSDSEFLLCASQKIANRIWTNQSLRYISYSRWFRRFIKKPWPRNFLLCPIFNPIKNILYRNSNKPHVNAAGDFIMAHKSVWEQLGGFDQRPFLSYIDGYAIFNLIALGFKQVVLPFPIYHINHVESNSKRKMLHHKEFVKDGEEILAEKRPKHTGPPDWGFPNLRFEEKII